MLRESRQVGAVVMYKCDDYCPLIEVPSSGSSMESTAWRSEEDGRQLSQVVSVSASLSEASSKDESPIVAIQLNTVGKHGS